MTLNWPTKDPDEVLDYQIDWTARLGNDTISTSLWIIPDGITKDSESNTTTTTTIWLSGGVLKTQQKLTNRVVTVGGRTMDQSVVITILEKQEDALNGVVKYEWVSGDTDDAGWFQAEFEVTYMDSTVDTFPNSGYIGVVIEPQLA